MVQANAEGGLAGAPGRTFERVSVVKALSGRKIPTSTAYGYAGSGAELVVVERYAGVDAAVLEQIERDARATMSLRHPNVVLVRDVWREKDELCVACEYVEGETLEELRKLGTGGKELSIEVGVRVVVDVLGALSAIHTLGSGALAHGEVTATNAIVGFDGVTRLVRPYRGRVAGKVAEADWFSYAAPEVIRGAAADVRADLYAVGVLLWETLSRRKLFPKATREGRAARNLPVGKPAAPPDASWAAPLGAVAERALSNDPAARYTTAAEMAAAVRLAVRSKLAMPPRVAAAVDKLAGERVLARRSANALPEETGARISVRPSRPPLPPEATRALATMRASSRPPTPKPGAVVEVPTIPKTAPLPSIEARTKPRPAAPPLKLAEPPPKPKFPPPKAQPAPVSVDDDAFAEEEPPTRPITAPAAALVAKEVAKAEVAKPEVAKPEVAKVEAPVAAPIATPEPTPAPPPPPETVDAAIVPAGVPNKKSGRTAMIAAAVLVTLIAIGAVLKVALAPASPSTTPTSTAHASATQAVATKSTATATVTATATTTASAPATADSATTTEPDPSATGATPPSDSSRRPRTRPRPTYDPMGI